MRKLFGEAGEQMTKIVCSRQDVRHCCDFTYAFFQFPQQKLKPFTIRGEIKDETGTLLATFTDKYGLGSLILSHTAVGHHVQELSLNHLTGAAVLKLQGIVRERIPPIIFSQYESNP